ncbi:MAG: EamA family transporter [Ignavibacteriaceae bacterium]|nr:EamA family transporter [Ignavibacteriaceae bacterium]
MMSENYKIYSGYVALAVIWGSTWLVIKIGLESFTPLFSAGVRFLIAALTIFIVLRIRSIKLQRDPIAVRLYLFMGLFSFYIPFGLVYWGEQFVNSGLASVLFAVYPFAVAGVSSFLIPEEKVSREKIAGMVFGFSGIILIFWDDFNFNFSNQMLGMLAIVTSALMQSTVVVAVKKWGNHLNSFSMNFVPMAIAGILFTLSGVLFEDYSYNKWDLKGLASIAYLGIFGSVVTFTTYYWILKRINVVLLSLLTFITPIVALLLGWIFYGEQLKPNQYAGSALVCAGILIANLFNSLKKS